MLKAREVRGQVPFPQNTRTFSVQEQKLTDLKEHETQGATTVLYLYLECRRKCKYSINTGEASEVPGPLESILHPSPECSRRTLYKASFRFLQSWRGRPTPPPPPPNRPSPTILAATKMQVITRRWFLRCWRSGPNSSKAAAPLSTFRPDRVRQEVAVVAVAVGLEVSVGTTAARLMVVTLVIATETTKTMILSTQAGKTRETRQDERRGESQARRVRGGCSLLFSSAPLYCVQYSTVQYCTVDYIFLSWGMEVSSIPS